MGSSVPFYLKNRVNALIYAIAVYGVFNFTNMYLFQDFSFKFACIDMLYGVCSLLIITCIIYIIRHRVL